MSKYVRTAPQKRPRLQTRSAGFCRAASGVPAGRVLGSGPCLGGPYRSGFTILEILVVLGIAALIGAITLGGFSQLAASQKRTTCQTNMTQLYQACRLYQADEGAFPFFDPSGATPADTNIGLWHLFAFPDYANTNGLSAAGSQHITRYLKSVNTLHCPQDYESGHDVKTDTTGLIWNTQFLSYQAEDPDSGEWTYQSIRTTNTGDAAFWKRQLQPSTPDGPDADVLGDAVAVPPANDTIVTWCPWHRKALGGRAVDNVLFYDGSVQLLPRTDSDGFSGWKRKQKSE